MSAKNSEDHADMLAIARAVIRTRAAMDDNNPETYDNEKDPEGYIISILNALHQWCHSHGMNWEDELQRAQGFFETDMGVSGPETEVREPALFEDLCCSKCGHKGSFVIEVSDFVIMYADGDVSHSDCPEEWNDDSYCRCYECDHEGKVLDFRPEVKEAVSDG